MKYYIKYSMLALVALLAVSLVVCGGLSAPAKAAGATYYVDCSASTNGDGSQSSPWNNVTDPSNTTFAPGDSILLKRGTTCSGQLWPKGSGAPGSPITIGAYGTGPLPLIDGGANDAVIKLWNQEYWHLENLETTGGGVWGVHISGDVADTLDHFRVTNVIAHDVTGIATDKSSGLFGIEAQWGSPTIINDVIVDGAAGYNTGRWNGIRVMCGGSSVQPNNPDPVIIRNMTAYTVGGDGIVLYVCNHGLIETSLAYDTGNKETDNGKTPNAIWTWMCGDCTVQYNEAYWSDSPAGDGGGYDVDWGCTDNIYQYNYAHDNEHYCISVFGAERDTWTINSTVRYNICSNNCRDPNRKVNRVGEVYVTIWSQGTIQDTFIYNNTFYWNPSNTTEYYAIRQNNIWHGKTIINTNYYNNIIYSDNPHMINIEDFVSTTTFDHNLYWYTGAGDPDWVWDGSTYTSFAAFQSGTGQEANGMYANPLLNDPTYHGIGMPTTQFTLQSGSPAIDAGADLVALGVVTDMGTQDFFGNAIPQGSGYDIGAHEHGGGPPPTATPAPPTNTPGGPTDTPPPPTDTPLPPTDTPTPVGGTNLALGKPVTESSFHSDHPGSEAVDGSMDTYWRTLKGSDLPSEWIKVDLGGSYTVGQVVLEWKPDTSRYATAYTIQVSENDVDWTTVYQTTTGDGGTDTINFGGTSARYVMMDSTAWTNDTERNYLCEYEVYGVGGPPPTDTPIPPTDTPPPPTDTPIPPTDTPTGPTDTPVPPTDTPVPPTDTPVPPTDTPAPTNTPGGGGNLALGKTTEVSDFQDGHPGSHAVDGDLATLWRSRKIKRNETRPPSWITVDLGTSYTISQVVLEWGADNSRYATSYTIDVSPDNSNWTTVYSTTTGDGLTDVCDFTATSARYVRLYTTVWTVEWEGNYLDEFEIYQ